MADVQIQQTPEAGGGASWVWGLVVLVLVALVAWFIFGGGLHRSSTTNLNVNVPGQSGGGSGSGGSGGGTAGGGTGGGATKTP